MCAPFDPARLAHSLQSIRSLTKEEPGKYATALQALLASAGVALVISNHFPGTMAHGATFWIHKHKAVLMITIRGVWADIFWFSLFHEIGHILLHRSEDLIIETDAPLESEKQREAEADAFASNALIPDEDYRRFVAAGSFYRDDIVQFARIAGVHRGIVVGRLQHDRLIEPRWHQKLRSRLKFASPPAL